MDVIINIIFKIYVMLYRKSPERTMGVSPCIYRDIMARKGDKGNKGRAPDT
jgi:hypothetical protein